jgi:chromosome segregation ATPase
VTAGQTAIMLAAILGGGGITGAIVAFFRVKPDVRKTDAEGTEVLIRSATGLVVTSGQVIEDLREENSRLRQDVAAIRKDLDGRIERLMGDLARTIRERDGALERLDVVVEERDELLRNNQELRSRVRTLEAKVERLEQSNPDPSKENG